MKKFRIISKNTQEHWLELEGWSEGTGTLQEDGTIAPIMDTHVVCKWDGCVDYRHYFNGYGWDHERGDDCECCEDYIHICDIDEFLFGLQEIKNIAKEFFKGREDWS